MTDGNHPGCADPLGRLDSALRLVARELGGESAGKGISLERPPDPKLGDYSTNAALVLASAAKRPPRELAEAIGERMRKELGARISRFEVAGPGFLNLFLDGMWHRQALAGILAEGERFGGGTGGERILVEFVSANPTGPMHVGHARNAAYGDALARILQFDGCRVEREFYVNDAGSQVVKLGESIRAVASGGQAPEDGYRGDYVGELAKRIEGASEKSADELGQEAVAVMVGEMERSLRAFNVEAYDHWQYESDLHRAGAPAGAVQSASGGRAGSGAGGRTGSGAGGQTGSGAGGVSAVEHAMELLGEQGMTYLEDGALWLRSSELGDDKDRVLRRSNGQWTYFASDVAYHQAKRERGFDRQIDVWGADHHGYLARMRAAYKALGGDPEELEMVTMQLVHLVRSGQRAQMSKRAGEFVTLDDLVAEIGVDAARWFLLSRSHDTTIDLDLDLAVKQSNENPVYYVQYAHARISSIVAKAGSGKVAEAVAAAVAEGHAGEELLHDSERELVKALLAFRGEVEEAAGRRAPHRIAAYALDLAQRFTAFYRDCRVVGAEPESVEQWRLALCVAAQGVLARSLGLLGVSAPAEM